MKLCRALLAILIPTILMTPAPTFAQPEVEAWGNLIGIRVDGQLMEFETSLRVVDQNWTDISQTAKERQRPDYRREGNSRIITTRIDSLFFTEVVEGSARGVATVDVEMTSRADTNLAGVYFSIALPGDVYGSGMVHLIEPAQLSLADFDPDGKDEYLRAVAGGIRLETPSRSLEVTTDEAVEVIVRSESNEGEAVVQVYLALASGNITLGHIAHRTFTLTATGEIDTRPVHLSLDATQPGRKFDGLGGNFRLQNPRTDPPVIEYNLENLRVAWARVDMPWMLWHPEEEVDPVESADAGNLHSRVAASMEMAKRVHEMGIPVMLAVWFGPEWAIVGERSSGRGPDGLWGNALNPEKSAEIYESLTSYMLYLRDNYGVDVEMFSFNESDLGIDIRQTADEHAQLIKGLGRHMESKGLDTKLLLGDTADIRGFDFINAAMEDVETHPYIGAVSFHSWRGWSTENLEKWDAAAERMNVPLVVGEGSIDAAAWRYPEIFLEPTYAREEINLYTRILAITEPLTILQWQLTADYSMLVGGGVFGNDDEPLRPTQRFWNFKQLASTPPGLFHLPIEANRADVTSAALGDADRELYAVHLVNNGTTREATLTGLPGEISTLRMYVTDSDSGMEEKETVPVSNGEARFTLSTTSFTSLFAGK